MIIVDLLRRKITHNLYSMTWGLGAQRKSHDHIFKFANFVLHWELHHSVIPSSALQEVQAGLWRVRAGGQESGTWKSEPVYNRSSADYIAYQYKYIFYV